MTLNNIHNALSNMLNDMDIAQHYDANVYSIDEEHHDVVVHARINPNKFVMICVMISDNNLEVKMVDHSQISPMFAQMILENLAIQINPDYYN